MRRVIDTTPNLKRHIDEMERGNIKYYLYDIAEVHNILEASLKEVFRIDKQERKKRKRMKKMNNNSSDNNKEEEGAGEE